MKTIKNIVILSLITFTHLVYAQREDRGNPPSIEEITAKQIEEINEKIDLDELQKHLLEKHLTELNNDRRTILNTDESKEVKREKMQQLDQDYLPKFQAFLSIEQYKLLLEVREEMEQKRQQRRGFKGNRNRRSSDM